MNFFEIWLSFLEGLALIFSACILPMLPIVLSTSVEGGRKRPFGIILGFIMAFSSFAFLSRTLVMALGFNLNIIRYSSFVLLALCGFVLLSSTMSDTFSVYTQRFSNVGHRLFRNANDGFFSGILIGLLIGVVWTPCAGPILSAALVQIIQQKYDFNAILMVTSFVVGVSFPMLLISLIGKSMMEKFGFLIKHTESVRKVFGVIILLSIGFMVLEGDAQFFSVSNDSSSTMIEKSFGSKVSGLQGTLETPYPAPKFIGLITWLNSKPLTIEELKNKVILIDFWTYSCINCIRTLPYIKRWYRDYREKGLIIIGIHAPEFEFEKNVANVNNAIIRYHIEYPVALDNNLDTWTSFKNLYWPAHYLIDQKGRVVYKHFGEGSYLETENNIRYLLGFEKKIDVIEDKAAISRNQSPETYLGYKRSKNFFSVENMKHDATQIYTAPKFIPSNHWALSGAWTVGSEHVTSEAAGAALQYNFISGKVFLVLGTKGGKPIRARLTLNREPLGQAAGSDVVNGVLDVEQYKLYELISQSKVKNGLLKIEADSPGLEAYAFTFGK
ncbi:DipZ protein [Liberibacter crescens BT-1]|uniref:DipZ protein n=1 Tax=Liberibacter crescens (strain BT-1) TaxID=1215343 RepID=L0EW81_LIBCB|nr:cytochrome c biogenesis protein DipZ [Liberibacter crescens]AGA65217.1 DipZ protein [Liberibacter crescens BT-1]AMC13167.1 DipZ protein [Liberibacter crescens]